MPIKNIKKNLINGNVQHNKVIDDCNKRCNDIKFGADDSDSEEESHIWTAKDDSLKGIKGVIETLKDEEFYWDNSSDGKQSHKNFKEWLDSVCLKLYDLKKNDNDELIFN